MSTSGKGHCFVIIWEAGVVKRLQNRLYFLSRYLWSLQYDFAALIKKCNLFLYPLNLGWPMTCLNIRSVCTGSKSRPQSLVGASFVAGAILLEDERHGVATDILTR